MYYIHRYNTKPDFRGSTQISLSVYGTINMYHINDFFRIDTINCEILHKLSFMNIIRTSTELEIRHPFSFIKSSKQTIF
jgi:hypothetical protein